MRMFSSETQEGKSQWLNGALVGALFILVLDIIPDVVDWIGANVLTANPIQAFVNWGMAERVYHYTAFELLYGVLGTVILLIIFAGLVLGILYGPRMGVR